MRRILTTMPDLMEISTAAVSISLLSHIQMPCIPRNRFDDSRPVDDYVMPRVIKSAKTLPLPKIFIELIEENIRKICEGLTNWVKYHYPTMFLSSGRKYDLFCIVSDFVWYPNGAVNYKQTALRLQNTPRLSDVQKFRLLCTYCLKEEIEQKWPVLFENDAYDRLDFAESPLIHYWNSYCRNTLDKISVPVGMSLDSYMFQNAEVDNWPAKEYFFDRMSAEEKIQNTISVIENEPYMYRNEMLMKLNETQLIQLYVDRPVEIFASSLLYSTVEDALSKWFQMKELINAGHFVSIIKKLFLSKYSCENSIVVEVWTSASNEFKHFFLSNNNEETFTQLWPLWIKTYKGDSYKMLLDTSVDVRKAIREKAVFTEHCEYLLTSRQISLLKRLLNLCFDNGEELKMFKHNHIHQLLSFHTACEQFITDGDLDSLEQLLKFSFCEDQELIQFGVVLANEKIFFDFCKHIIQDRDLPKLKRLWSLLLPRTEDSSRLKLHFAKQVMFNTTDFSFLRIFLKNFEVEFLQELIEFFSSKTSEFVQLKLNFAQTNYFRQRCVDLISNSTVEKLQTLLNTIFDTPKQSAPLRQLIITSFSNNFRNIVSSCDFSMSKLEMLMDLITFDSTTVISPATRKSIDKLKKTTFFSSPCIAVFRELVEGNRLKEVKKFFYRFHLFEKDKEALRLKLFSTPDQLVKKFFFEYDESACKSWMEWWFNDEKSLQKCKREISVNSIFEEELRKCVFQSYDKSGPISHCILNKDFEFGALDRFLKWRFYSAKDVKGYKLRRIDEYKSIETVLIKKGCHASYFNKLTEFFFENDPVEMTKFEKKHVRVSYFEQ